MRLPEEPVTAPEAKAAARAIPCQRLIREAIEKAV